MHGQKNIKLVEKFVNAPKVLNISWFLPFAVSWMLYAFFRVIPRRLTFICRRFGTLFNIHRQVGVCRMSTA